MKFQENIPLSKLSHYKIGGIARYFFAAKNEREIVWAVKEAKNKKLPIFIIGGGTNLLIGDEGWNGLVLKPNIITLELSAHGGSAFGGKGETLLAGAGVIMGNLIAFALKNSLSGLEWAGGLPGTFGGAIRGNAGCFGGEIKDSVQLVRSFDIKTMTIRERVIKECKFGYRNSIFKKKNGNEVILSVELRLIKGDKKKISEIIKKNIAYRNENHPLEYPNIGSIFKNVSLAAIHEKGSVKYKKAVADTSLLYRGSQFSVKTDPLPVISAAKLISEAGLCGVTLGGAMISPKHSNFIVNVLDARADDVKSLITLAKTEVHKKFGITLEEEVQLV